MAMPGPEDGSTISHRGKPTHDPVRYGPRVGTDLDRGREAFGRRKWGQAYAGLRACDAVAPLDPDDLERLAIAATLTGHEDDGDAAWARAFRELAGRRDGPRAAR